MPIIDVLLVIVLALLVIVLLRGRSQSQQQQLETAFNRQQLEDAFYKLLEQNSCISLIQLAAAARIDSKQAQQYLEHQVQVFSAVLEVDADGDTFYRFPKLHQHVAADRSRLNG